MTKSRVDVHTLVLAFERRIEALEKNPPDKVPTSVIMNLLEKAIEDEIKNHFVFQAQRDIKAIVKSEYKEKKEELIKQVLNDIFDNEDFKKSLSNEIGKRIIASITE